MRILEEISPVAGDDIYILGDVIDRGSDVAAVLVSCVELSRRYPNFHFLLGNHEHMCYQYLLDGESIDRDEMKHWLGNVSGSEATTTALDALDREWVAHELVPWFSSLLYYDTVKVDGQEWMLVHAGFDPDRFGNERKKYWEDVLVPGGFGQQSLSDMIWIRDKWILDRREAPLPVIHGHTPTTYFRGKLGALEQAIGESVYQSDGGILYYKNKIDIDCGAGEGSALGCLRIDDLQEFYARIG